MPPTVRRVLGAIGIGLTLVSMLLLVFPDIMIPTWPWRLSPLTSRVMGAMFVLPGLVGIRIWLDGRWSAARFILQAQIGAIALIVLAIVLSQAEFNGSQPGAWFFAGGMLLLGVGLLALYTWMERRRI